MVEVVCWLPVIEYFVAVLNRGKDGGNDVGCEEDVEGDYGFELRRAWLLGDTFTAKGSAQELNWPASIPKSLLSRLLTCRCRIAWLGWHVVEESKARHKTEKRAIKMMISWVN